MQPTRLTMRGITCFGDVSLDLSALDGLIAITGPNGSGKTTIMEALLPGALFREFPSRDSHRLIDSATTRDALLEVEFSWRGGTLRAVHQLDPEAGGGRGKTESYLYADGEPVAGTGKAGDYSNAVAARFPPIGVFLASAFACQTGAGNFLDLPRTARRQLFADLLGLEELQALAQRAREAAKHAARRVDIIGAQHTRAIQAAGELDRISGLIDVAEQKVDALTADHEAAKETADRARDRWRAVEAEVKAANAAATARRHLDDELSRRRREWKDAHERGRRARSNATGTIEAAREEVERLTAEVRKHLQVVEDNPDRSHGIALGQRSGGRLKEVPCGGDVLFGEEGVPVDCGACPLISDARQAVDMLPAAVAQQERRDEAVSRAAAVNLDLQAARGNLDAHELAIELHAKAKAVEEIASEIKAKLAGLPDPVEVEGADAAKRSHDAARSNLSRVERALREAYAELSRLQGRQEATRAQLVDVEAVEERLAVLRRLAGGMNRIHKALGRDGVQALEIDAAGPEVGDLVNRLLDACYGPRFAVQLRTVQEATAGRKQKEVFDVVVHDGRSGDSRLVGDLSGGERVLVGEALKLALSVFHARRSGVACRTLWRDEVDGALDHDTASRYPAMLREAMTIGGFDRCYFVTHREDVSSQADHTIRCEAGSASLDA